MRGRREQIQLPGGHSFRVLRWTRSVRDVESMLAPGLAARLTGEGDHWHYHSAMELTWFEEGEGVRFVGNHIGPFARGDVVLLGDNLPHYWHARGRSAGLAAQWWFPHGHAIWSLPEALPLGALFREAGRGIRYTGATAAAAAAGLSGLAGSAGAERLGRLLCLLARLGAAPASERAHLSGKSYARPESTTHQQAISEAVRYLLANFRDQVRLGDLLELTRMSKATFSRQFRKHSGKTCGAFLASLRLESTCRELRDTDLPITEIALASGFSQISFFNRIFRRQMRCSPRDYRARHRPGDVLRHGFGIVMPDRNARFPPPEALSRPGSRDRKRRAGACWVSPRPQPPRPGAGPQARSTPDRLGEHLPLLLPSARAKV
ncbi:MAG: AraC family transcriptional regulator [Kiritimatiellia bacterium]